MPRSLSVRLGVTTTLAVTMRPLYAAIDAELGAACLRDPRNSLRATPWIGAALGAALLLPAAASANTITVDSLDWSSSVDGNCTVPEAVEAANTNVAVDGCAAGAAGLDDIQFDPALTYPATINVDSRLNVSEPLNITGPSTPDQLLFDGGNNYQFIEASADVSLANLTAQSFYARYYGGVVNSSASVTASNSMFLRNRANYYGGAIFSEGTVTATNSTFSYNRTYVSGGAIDASSATISGSTFFANSAGKYDGGAILARSSATVTSSQFSYNSVGYGTLGNQNYSDITPIGGAISAGSIAISGNSSFTKNRAYQPAYGSSAGGAVFSSYGGTISGSQFNDNSSANGGAVFAGGIPYAAGGPPMRQSRRGQQRVAQAIPPSLDLSIVSSQFERNQAMSYGPASSATLSGGGAIGVAPFAYGGDPNQITITNSVLSENRAIGLPAGRGQSVRNDKLAPGPIGDGVGGGLAVINAKTLFGSTATMQANNKAGLVPSDTTLTISGTTFNDNLAVVGGGAAVFASTVTVDQSTFDSNGAYLGGGGLFLPENLDPKYAGPGSPPSTGTSTAFTTTTFNNNRAIGMAGVVAFADTVSGTGLNLTNNETGLPPQLYGEPLPRGLASKVTLGSGSPLACSAGKYGGGGALVSMSSTQLTGGSQITGNCGGYAVGGVGMASGKYGSGGSSITVAPDTLVSNNRSYGKSPGMAVYINYAGAAGSASISGTFTNNRVTGDVPGAGGGLSLYADASTSIVVDQATISGNRAAQGGGIVIGNSIGGAFGSVTISNSTVSGNTAVEGGGIAITATSATLRSTPPVGQRFPALAERLANLGIERPFGRAKGKSNHSKGMPLPAPVTIHIENSTIDDNTTEATTTTLTQQGGGLFSNPSDLSFDHVTITGNSTGGDGGGMMLNAGVPTVSNSIIGLNSASGTGNDVNGSLDIDYSLVQDTAGGTLNGANNLTGIDPMLDALADNGGPTLTRLPQFGSPVVDAGDPAFSPPPADDQRGPGFPRDAGGLTDMGAVEGVSPVNVVSLAIVPAAFSEGASATMTVNLDAATTSDVLVTIDFSGTAVLTTDFNSGDDDGGTAGVQIQVLAGDTSGSVTLDAIADSLNEPDEPFSASVSSADFALVPNPVSANGTILDGDPLSFSIADASGAESIGNLDFNVSLNVPSTQAVSITAATTNGTALAGADFSAVNTTVNFPAGMTSMPVSVPIIDDAIAEPTETFAVNLSSPSAGSIADGSAVGTIVDDESMPTVSLSLTPPSNPEGGGSFIVTANLSGPSSQNVVVTLDFSGTATFGSDYDVTDQDPATPGIQIIIPAGSTSSSVTVTPLNDGVDEPDETIIVGIGSATGAGATGAPGSGTITNVAAPGGPAAVVGPAMIPTLSEWMLALLGLLLPAAVMVKLRRQRDA